MLNRGYNSLSVLDLDLAMQIFTVIELKCKHLETINSLLTQPLYKLFTLEQKQTYSNVLYKKKDCHICFLILYLIFCRIECSLIKCHGEHFKFCKCEPYNVFNLLLSLLKTEQRFYRSIFKKSDIFSGYKKGRTKCI